MSVLLPPLNPMPPIPIGYKHPGAFGYNRHEHVHTGVDLYAPHGCPVTAMEMGVIFDICWFTGPSINMPWWNDTKAVYIEGNTGVFCYGEIEPFPGLEKGMEVRKGQLIGHVLTVLRRFKGRPMSMLHLELYDHGYKDDWSEWEIGDSKPEHLKDPTSLLMQIPGCTAYSEDPYFESHKIWEENEKKTG